MPNTSSIQLLVGLGNPGPEYAATRHNAGAWLVQQLAAQHDQAFSLQSKLYASLGKIELGEQQCRLVIPAVFMNNSGQAICAVANYYKILPQNILIAHDDIDLPPGTVRLKYDGGHGGHNGLRDACKSLGTKAFYRLRIGVGKAKHRDAVADYVLARPSKSEQSLIDDSIDAALRVMPDVLQGNIEKAMQALHTN